MAFRRSRVRLPSAPFFPRVLGLAKKRDRISTRRLGLCSLIIAICWASAAYSQDTEQLRILKDRGKVIDNAVPIEEYARKQAAEIKATELPRMAPYMIQQLTAGLLVFDIHGVISSGVGQDASGPVIDVEVNNSFDPEDEPKVRHLYPGLRVNVKYPEVSSCDAAPLWSPQVYAPREKALMDEGILAKVDTSLSGKDLDSYLAGLERAGSRALQVPGVVTLDLGPRPLGEGVMLWVNVCPGFTQEAESELRGLFSGLDVAFVRAGLPTGRFGRGSMSPERLRNRCQDTTSKNREQTAGERLKELVRRGLVEEAMIDEIDQIIALEPELESYVRKLKENRSKILELPGVSAAAVGRDRKGKLAIKVHIYCDGGISGRVAELLFGFNFEIVKPDVGIELL